MLRKFLNPFYLTKKDKVNGENLWIKMSKTN